MISFPNGKINIGLQITGRRNDGYHNLETVFFPVLLQDILEVVRSTEFKFNNTGIPVDSSAQNICVNAYQLLKDNFPLIPAVHIHLHKIIPLGSGLGGGSSDAAFCLMLLNDLLDLNLTKSQLLDFATQLGSDCPFFIINKPCYASGRGEILKEVPIDLSAYKILLVNCGVSISTAQAFAGITGYSKPGALESAICQPVEKWKEIICNDFEKSIFGRYPEINVIKEELYKSGAIYASMSGSGSTVYGLYKKEDMPIISFPENYFWKWV